jgi:hypothetical protein
MSAERVAASSRVRFEVTGRPSLLRISRGFAAVRTAHIRSQVNGTDPCSGRLLVRPYLPVGVDHLTLNPRGAEGPLAHLRLREVRRTAAPARLLSSRRAGASSAGGAAPPPARGPGPSRPLVRGSCRARRPRPLPAAGLLRGVAGPGLRSAGVSRLGRLSLGELLGARPGHVPGPHGGIERQLHSRHGIILLSPVSYKSRLRGIRPPDRDRDRDVTTTMCIAVVRTTAM